MEVGDQASCVAPRAPSNELLHRALAVNTGYFPLAFPLRSPDIRGDHWRLSTECRQPQGVKEVPPTSSVVKLDQTARVYVFRARSNGIARAASLERSIPG
ncbi:hypothetical protein CIHG_09542 [Coccidioides immitis H538.4]|uniref:Uncharacterized protein n=2 Tax=Coccidioides immitis TaxID=5501 RepID=A0A0J8S4K9_COCIT|nr:hypothetical protein CIRG_04673 [Coccidioides immitis RMSCC 2394]KMU91736.1 hypothetical protein CIHG_09542 [Coccidioides immitis H538.4]